MPGRVVRVVEIPARHGAALEVPRGLVLRVIDVEGQQVGDFVCFNRDDLVERYSPQNTVLFNRTIYPGVGAALVSDRGRPMMRLVADTVGVHDLICGSCSEEYYRNRLDYTGPHRSCRSNLAEALAPWGVELQDVPFSFNFFMQWPVQPDGSVRPWRRRRGRATTSTSWPRWTSWRPTRRARRTSRRPTPTVRRPCDSSSTSRIPARPAGTSR